MMATILVVDFFGDSGYLLRAILRGRDYDAYLACSLEQAQHTLDEYAVDAMLIDLKTPIEPHHVLIEHATLTHHGKLPLLAVLDVRQRFRYDTRLNAFPRGNFASVIRPPYRGNMMDAAIMSAISATQPEAERRTSPRQPLDVAVSLQVGQSIVPCRTLDVSEQGAALLPMLGEAAQQIMLGKIKSAQRAEEALHVWIELPGGQARPMQMPAEFVGSRMMGRGAQQVWRIRFPRAGMRLDGLDSQNQRHAA